MRQPALRRIRHLCDRHRTAVKIAVQRLFDDSAVHIHSADGHRIRGIRGKAFRQYSKDGWHCDPRRVRRDGLNDRFAASRPVHDFGANRLAGDEREGNAYAFGRRLHRRVAEFRLIGRRCLRRTVGEGGRVMHRGVIRRNAFCCCRAARKPQFVEGRAVGHFRPGRITAYCKLLSVVRRRSDRHCSAQHAVRIATGRSPVVDKGQIDPGIGHRRHIHVGCRAGRAAHVEPPDVVIVGNLLDLPAVGVIVGPLAAHQPFPPFAVVVIAHDPSRKGKPAAKIEGIVVRR